MDEIKKKSNKEIFLRAIAEKRERHKKRYANEFELVKLKLKKTITFENFMENIDYHTIFVNVNFNGCESHGEETAAYISYLLYKIGLDDAGITYTCEKEKFSEHLKIIFEFPTDLNKIYSKLGN